MALKSSSDYDVLSLSQQGQIPFFNEEESFFQKRISLTQEDPKDNPIPDLLLKEGQEYLRSHLGCFPSYIKGYFFKNKIFMTLGYTECGEKTTHHIALSSVFLRKKSFWGYHRQEVLAHEMIHAMRYGFDDSPYEEILAYSLSPFFWRRFLGPFVATLSFKIIISLLVFFTISHLLVSFFTFIGWIFLSSLSTFFLTCYLVTISLNYARSLWIYRKVYRKIQKSVPSHKNIRLLILHLSGEEIEAIALCSGQNLEELLGKIDKQIWRHVYLRKLFFSV